MRWIDRGPEPDGVAGYARQFTPGWVDYFQDGAGSLPGQRRPEDHRWGEFRPVLGGRSNNACWYCERNCDADAAIGNSAPTVDHFRPVSRFPQLAYAWSNWVFSCLSCNENKGNRWPDTGYVDPCAAAVAERPEQYFEFDAGDIIPKIGLPPADQRKAWATIDDLQLNNRVFRAYRQQKLAQFLKELRACPEDEKAAFVVARLEQPGEFAGVTRMFVEYLSRRGRNPR